MKSTLTVLCVPGTGLQSSLSSQRLDGAPKRLPAVRLLCSGIGAALLFSGFMALPASAQSLSSPFAKLLPAGSSFPAPVANIATDRITNKGDLVPLDGTSSSALSGRTLNYTWALQTKPTGSAATLASTTGSKSSFVADVPGFYVASLQVSDGLKTSVVATAQINALAPVGQKGVESPTQTGRKLAVLVVSFPDTPTDLVAKMPSNDLIKKVFFGDLMTKFWSDMSYGKFNRLETDFYGPVKLTINGWDPVKRQVVSEVDIMNNARFDIPDFDAKHYDSIVVVPLHDALQDVATGGSPGWFYDTNNIRHYFPGHMYLPVMTGYQYRVRPGAYYQLDGSTLGCRGMVVTGVDMEKSLTIPTIEGGGMRTVMHEFGHYLGIYSHAQSRTNGASFDYQPEVPNNWFQREDPSLPHSDLLDLAYGDRFDVMGSTSGCHSTNLNHVYRNKMGWHDSSNLKSIRSSSLQTVTIYPSHVTTGVRAVEIRIPFKYSLEADSTGRKNQGYFLEVHNASGYWDKVLGDPALVGNTQGIFVHKTDGFTSWLLDMSPVPNIKFFDKNWPDMRDVVLKPGMVYDNGEVRLSNVRKNADGSFTLDVRVY